MLDENSGHDFGLITLSLGILWGFFIGGFLWRLLL